MYNFDIQIREWYVQPDRLVENFQSDSTSKRFQSTQPVSIADTYTGSILFLPEIQHLALDCKNQMYSYKPNQFRPKWFLSLNTNKNNCQESNYRLYCIKQKLVVWYCPT